MPSGLLWADRNLGALSPEKNGKFYSWGNLIGHSEDSGYDFSQEEYDLTPGAAITDNLSLSQDAARVSLGSPWRMPSTSEFEELVNNCAHEWTTLNGVQGMLFTSNVNGNTLFLPANGFINSTNHINQGLDGYYWSTVMQTELLALYLLFSDSYMNPQRDGSRRLGYSIRAVVSPNDLTRTANRSEDQKVMDDNSTGLSMVDKSDDHSEKELIENESR